MNTTMQCKGITKSGTRCKNRNSLVDGYCRLHQDQKSAPEQTAQQPEPPVSDLNPPEDATAELPGVEEQNPCCCTGNSWGWVLIHIILGIVVAAVVMGNLRHRAADGRRT